MKKTLILLILVIIPIAIALKTETTGLEAYLFYGSGGGSQNILNMNVSYGFGQTAIINTSVSDYHFQQGIFYINNITVSPIEIVIVEGIIGVRGGFFFYNVNIPHLEEWY